MNSMENLHLAAMNSNRETASTEQQRSILIIDNGHRDRRRERTAILNNAGYKVHPARSFEQSLSRVGSGSYDLVIANTDGAVEDAVKFCQDVKRNYPRQLLLLIKPANTEIGEGIDAAANDPKSLLERAQAMLQPAERSTEKPLAA